MENLLKYRLKRSLTKLPATKTLLYSNETYVVYLCVFFCWEKSM